MHMASTSSNNIKSISQLHLQMIQKKNAVLRKIQELCIPSLPLNLDFENNNVTLDKIFSQIPSEDKLKEILQHLPQKELLQNKLRNYCGDYDIVKKAAYKAQSIKPQAKQIYTLFAQLNLPRIRQDFKIARQSETIKLSSFQVLTQQIQAKSQKMDSDRNQDKQFSLLHNSSNTKPEPIKATKFERNMISEDHIYSVKQDSKYEQILPPSQYLKQDDLLVHICIYDSLSGQKQHEFIFLGDMKLMEVKKQIYCKIQKISGENQHYTSATSKKQSETKLHEQKSFFLIEQNIYYQGTHHSQNQIDALIKNIKISYQSQIYKFSMNQTEIKNLRVVFGRPYLFRHMGGCDHIIVFKDIRLYDKNGIDPDIRKKYPFMIFQSKMKKKKCEACQISFATLACVGDRLKNGSTSYLCKQCHQNIHNDLTNIKNLYMKVLPYLHQ